MNNRGLYALSAAVLIASALITFGPSWLSSVNANWRASGAPVIEVIEFKNGQKSILAIMPDGRYSVWRQFSSDDFHEPKHGTVGIYR